MNSKKCYFITKNYKAQFSAAGKAKIDCERTLERLGFKNIGLKRTTITNSILGSILTFTGTIIGLVRLRKGSIICVQYPIKKYYNLILYIAKLKKCHVITVIHDLRSHRKGKVSVVKEIASFNKSKVIVSHNEFMTQWLRDNLLKAKIVNLSIFDYLSEKTKKDINTESIEKFELVFAGALAKRKNSFLYDVDLLNPESYKFNLYGVGFNKDELKDESVICYKGFFPADEVVNYLEGHFGLVWDGNSLDECSGNFGEYLKINNPHKTSLYLRAGLPIIIWDKAALAKFVVDNGVGIKVSSLSDIDDQLSRINHIDYNKMRDAARVLGDKIGDGYFLEAAINECSML